jgi:hypothetical protein
MRPMSREVLARDAASRVAASTMPEGRCAGQGDRWTQLEQRHRRAGAEKAQDVIEEISRDFCHGCPARVGCAQWASVQQYTGLAAGAAYEEGERQDPVWSVPRSGRRKAS